MDSFLVTAASFVLALAILIAVHEFGHFWVARRLGVKVLRFSIGFGKPLWKRVSPVDGTEYVIAAIPLGGYVKMLDEREAPVDEDEVGRAFNRQSLWKRSAIVAAGPLFNFIFAIGAFWLVFVSGDVGLRPLIGEVESDSIAYQAGLRAGDELLAIDDKPSPTWEAAVYTLMDEYLDARDLAVRAKSADESESTYWLDGEALARLPEDPNILKSIGLSVQRPVAPPLIGQVVAGDPADIAGLRKGDLLLSADGEAINSWRDWVEYVRQRPGTAIAMRVLRNETEVDLRITPKQVLEGQQAVGRIGAGVDIPPGLYERYRVEIRLGPLEALSAAVGRTFEMSGLMLKVLGRMITGQASIENISGPISIAESAGKSASYGFTYFVKFLAVISISLGVLNLLPVPVLDGGHLMYFLIEAVKGGPVSESFMIQGQRIGVALLLGLMMLAFYVDLSRLLG
jgi:regulator of sigma E protease